MDSGQLISYCLQKQDAYEDFPFGDDYIVIKIKSEKKPKGVIFAEIFTLNGEKKFTFGTDSETAEFLRSVYPDVVVRGYHCPPVQARYKSTATLGRLDDEKVVKLVDLSYARALTKL